MQFGLQLNSSTLQPRTCEIACRNFWSKSAWRKPSGFTRLWPHNITCRRRFRCSGRYRCRSHSSCSPTDASIAGIMYSPAESYHTG